MSFRVSLDAWIVTAAGPKHPKRTRWADYEGQWQNTNKNNDTWWLYIIYLHLPRCAKFQTLMRKTPLPYGGQKKCPGAEKHFWSELYAIDSWCITCLRKYGSRCQTTTVNHFKQIQFVWEVPRVNHCLCFCASHAKTEPVHIWVSLLGTRHKWTTSCEFLCLGHATSEPFHMKFFTWDTPQVNHFIYEFLYLGHATSEPLHMSFFTWDTPQVNHFILISLLGIRHKWTTSYMNFFRHKWTTSYEFLYLRHATSEPLHMNFFAWDTPQVNHFIWVSVLWTRCKWTTSSEFLYLGYATSEPLHMNLFIWAPRSKRAHVSPTACFDKKTKSKGRKYPSKGRKYPSKGRNFPCVVSEVCHVKFYNFWKGTCKSPFLGMCNRLGLPDPFWGGETHLSCPKGFSSPTVA